MTQRQKKRAVQSKTKPRTAPGKNLAIEDAVLELVRLQFRTAMRKREQINITLDPWMGGGGLYVFAAPNALGRSWEVDDNGWRTK